MGGGGGKVEIVRVGAGVNGPGPAVKPNSDLVYQKLRQQTRTQGDFAGPFATVNGLVLKRDAAIFTLRTGEIYFAPDIEHREVGAVFLGDGELSLTPPTDAEKRSLKLFTDDPAISESFDRLILRF